jgi:CheY-like chemotaxis protein
MPEGSGKLPLYYRRYEGQASRFTAPPNPVTLNRDVTQRAFSPNHALTRMTTTSENMISQGAKTLELPENALRLILVCDEAPEGLSGTIRALDHSWVPCRYESLRSGMEVDAYMRRSYPFNNRGPEVPSLILVDYRVASADDGLLIRRIRASEIYSHLPIIVFSALDDQACIEECCRDGANGFIVVPFEAEEYQELLDRTLRYWLGLNYTVQFRNLLWQSRSRMPDSGI